MSGKKICPRREENLEHPNGTNKRVGDHQVEDCATGVLEEVDDRKEWENVAWKVAK